MILMMQDYDTLREGYAKIEEKQENGFNNWRKAMKMVLTTEEKQWKWS